MTRTITGLPISIPSHPLADAMMLHPSAADGGPRKTPAVHLPSRSSFA
ncbi:hypothetical protein [Roseomonas chloroacetimidivorans]